MILLDRVAPEALGGDIEAVLHRCQLRLRAHRADGNRGRHDGTRSHRTIFGAAEAAWGSGRSIATSVIRARMRWPRVNALAMTDRMAVFEARISAAAAADHRAHRLVGAEILGAVDIEQGGQLGSRAVDAALDGADRAAADRRGVLVGEAGRADQDQRFALVLRQLVAARRGIPRIRDARSAPAGSSASWHSCRRRPRPRAAACDSRSGTGCAGS